MLLKLQILKLLGKSHPFDEGAEQIQRPDHKVTMGEGVRPALNYLK